MAEAETVLVTGGSGYIGSWCVVESLKRGYVVRTTVRDLKRESEVRGAIAKQVDPGNRLSFHAVNLLSDDGWDAAVQGCDYVLHVASPLGVPLPKDPQDLIRPARQGAMRAVTAAIKAGVKRVVLTSSVAATYKASSGSWTSDETVWTDANDARVGPYPQSKTLAEQAAWETIKTANGRTTLATVNPALVIGPILSRDFSGSVQVISRLLSGRVPGLPRLGFCFVDVRDVVDLHLRAMTDPQAAGQRFIAAGDFAWMADIAALLRSRLGQQAARVPTRRVPDFMVRIISLFDTDLRYVVPSLGNRREFSSAKAQRMLGWKARPLEESVVDCANSLMALGAV
jgi:nucleoside-diphosphate-sugar epimerase